ncbi:MAG: orotidine-5'-phosphate decarboxylase [Planctomycetota bacterium]
MTAVFAPALVRAIQTKGSPACVGLDPVLDRLPEGIDRLDPARALEAFSTEVLHAVVAHVPAVKVQSACFERYGSPGFAAMERVIMRARDLGLVVIYDAKRGDIGVSARHYAAAAANIGAHAITLSPYLGPETIEPYLKEELGVFVLVRTSNPGSAPMQTPALTSGRGIAQHVASLTTFLGEAWIDPESGLSDVGAVVGATQSSEAAALRAIMPDQVFLVPGYGAQGGTADDIRVMRRPNAAGAHDAGVIVTASRSVIYAAPQDGEAWYQAVERAAKDLCDELSDVVAG